MSYNIALHEHNGNIVTSSREVARVFEKHHAHILRNYDEISANLDASFNGSNFGSIEYTAKSGKKNREILMTQAGFTLLAMGFTGERALKFKVAYITAFEAMAKQLHAPKQLSRKELALMVIEQETALEQLQQENSELKPKALEYQKVFDVLEMWTMTQAITKAGLVGVSAIKLHKYFVSQSYIYKRGKTWQVTKIGAETQMFNFKTSMSTKRFKVQTLCLNNAGVDYLYHNKAVIESFKEEAQHVN